MLKYGERIKHLYDRSPAPVKNIIATSYAFWTGRKKHGPVYKAWKELSLEAQHWSAEQQQEYRISKLREALAFAFTESPYYSGLLKKSGFKASSEDPIGVLGTLPTVSKEVIRRDFDMFVTKHWTNRRLVYVTSGTTGTPLRIPITGEALQRDNASRWLFISSKNVQERDRHVQFTGQSLVPIHRCTPPFHVRDYTNNALLFSVYHLSDGTMEHYLDALERFRPAYYYGYPSAFYALAGFMKRTGRRIPAPAALFSCSEKLHEFQRTLIEEMFSAPLFQWYGQSELTVNIYECEHKRLHVKEEYGYLELLRDDGAPALPGEPARAVATGWGNKAFPLLRYETGDRMILSPDQNCPCGRSGRIIEEILGRDEDVVVTPDGRSIGRLTGVFCEVDHVREGQIIQETVRDIRLRVVPSDGYSQKDEERLKANLRSYLGEDIAAVIELVDALPRSANGKVRHVISQVSSNKRRL